MPTNTKILYATGNGETFDPMSALLRHPSISGGESPECSLTAEGDAFPLPAPDGYAHKINSPFLTFTLTLTASKMAALTRVLNSAPVDGKPQHGIVNLYTDTDASEEEAEQIEKYLSNNEMHPTVENVAEAYLRADTDTTFLDIKSGRACYHVARIKSVDMQTSDGNAAGSAWARILTSDYNGRGLKPVAFEIYSADHSQVEGEDAKNANFTAVRYYAPSAGAPLGGILMESTNN